MNKINFEGIFWRRNSGLVLLSAFLLSIFLNVECVKKSTQFCNNYSTCLERLESKQRECLEFAADINSEPTKKKNKNLKKAAKNGNDCGVSKKRKNELLQELAQLHLRKTEILRDCINKNAHRGVLLPDAKERKCLSAAEKMSTFGELVQQTTETPIASKVKKARKAKRYVAIPKISAPLTATNNKYVEFVDTPTLGALRRKRKHVLTPKEKENAKKQQQHGKECRRSKKALNRKCHHIAKCCSVATECDLVAESLESQITDINEQLKSINCNNKKVSNNAKNSDKLQKITDDKN